MYMVLTELIALRTEYIRYFTVPSLLLWQLKLIRSFLAIPDFHFYFLPSILSAN
jgi:hypothetical protein